MVSKLRNSFTTFIKYYCRDKKKQLTRLSDYFIALNVESVLFYYYPDKCGIRSYFFIHIM